MMTQLTDQRPKYARASVLDIVEEDRARELCLNCPLSDCLGIGHPKCSLRAEARLQRLRLRQANAQEFGQRQPLRTGETGYRGVRLRKRKLAKPYAAVIQHKGGAIWLGYYHAAEEAARAYDTAARELHGEFARLNFPADQNAAGLESASTLAKP